MPKRTDHRRVQEALGSSRVVELEDGTSRGPLDLLHLGHDLYSRLRSSGGRPTDPAWSFTRQVPFKEETWTALRTLAEALAKSGRKISPAQVAAALLEEAVAELARSTAKPGRTAHFDPEAGPATRRVIASKQPTNPGAVSQSSRHPKHPR